MSEYYSTQTSVQARIYSLRLTGLIDFDADDSPDTAVLTSDYIFAREICRGKLVKKYGETVIDTWDSDTVPALVGQISDDLCIYRSITTNPMLTEVADKIYRNALELLDWLAGDEMDLYGVDYTVTGNIDTDRIDSDFEPERDTDDLTVNPYWTRDDPRDIDRY